MMNPENALLWEVAVKLSNRKRLRISGASANFSSAMKSYLAQREAVWIECFERPYTVERYVAAVTSTSEMYSVVVHLSMSLLRKGLTSLVSFPASGRYLLFWTIWWLLELTWSLLFRSMQIWMSPSLKQRNAEQITRALCFPLP